MQPLSHITFVLSGTSLIEASVATGKTYAIASLYLRLLVEQELLPEQSRFLALKAEAGSLWLIKGQTQG